MSKILIIGCGFVGSTVANSLEENTTHEIVRIDPKYYDTKLEEVHKLNELFKHS